MAAISVWSHAHRARATPTHFSRAPRLAPRCWATISSHRPSAGKAARTARPSPAAATAIAGLRDCAVRTRAAAIASLARTDRHLSDRGSKLPIPRRGTEVAEAEERGKGWIRHSPNPFFGQRPRIFIIPGLLERQRYRGRGAAPPAGPRTHRPARPRPTILNARSVPGAQPSGHRALRRPPPAGRCRER